MRKRSWSLGTRKIVAQASSLHQFNEKTDKLSRAAFVMIAPKGHNTIAQGNALGLVLLAK